MVALSLAGETITSIGSRRELFVDRLLIERMQDVELRAQQPIEKGPVLQLDQPWEGAFSGYFTDAFDWPLNTAKHPAQPPRFGSAPMNFLPGNGANWWDISAAKDFTFAERYRLEFRSEFFNAFNHTNFANPIVAPENPNFGRTFSTSVGPRTIQFGLKFYW